MALAPVNQVSGRAVYIPGADIDTDRIIPARFMKCITFDGLGEFAFYDVRFDEHGQPTAHPLNDPRFAGASILLAGLNFGCGSSREHAPWALLDFGIRCIIAPSFADIFYNNCFKNGILPIILPREQVDLLLADAERGANAIVTVDLVEQIITGPDGGTIRFSVDAFRRHCLLNGLDDIGLTLQQVGAIDTFETNQRGGQPWLWS